MVCQTEKQASRQTEFEEVTRDFVLGEEKEGKGRVVGRAVARGYLNLEERLGRSNNDEMAAQFAGLPSGYNTSCMRCSVLLSGPGGAREEWVAAPSPSHCIIYSRCGAVG